MTVKQLKESLDKYLQGGCTNTGHHLACSMCDQEICGYETRGKQRVIICDDGMQAKFYDTHFACGVDFSRKIESGDRIPEYKTEHGFMVCTDLNKEI